MAPIDFPGEKLAIKIWETLTEKGIGGLLTPWQIKREGLAHAEVRREEMLMLAQAERDAQDILAGRKALDATGKLIVEVKAIEAQPVALGALPQGVQDEALVYQRSPSPKLLTNAAEKFSAREVQRFVNLQRIAIHAEEQARLMRDEGVSEEPVDPDWLNQWRENAQDVSEEHMQKLWARILAEEVKTPGSYSMRTLGFLRTVSKTDASKIVAIGPFVIKNGNFIYVDQAFLDRKGLTFQNLIELQEMGVLSGVQNNGLELTVASTVQDKFRFGFTSYGKGLALERDAKDPALLLRVYRVTKLGQEILRLQDYRPDDEYLKLVGTAIKGRGFVVRYGDSVEDGIGMLLLNFIEL